MRFIIYTLAWALVFAGTSAAATIVTKQFGEGDLRRKFLSKDVRRVILVPGCVSLLSAVSLLSWAVIHMRWYEPPFGWVLGLFISGLLQRAFAPGSLRRLAPPTLVLLNVLLWLFPSARHTLPAATAFINTATTF